MADVSNITPAPKIPHPATKVSISDRWIAEFEASHAAYHEAAAGLSNCQRGRTNEAKVNKYLEDRDDAVWGLIRARTPYKWMLVEKTQLLLRLMEEDWADGRALVLAASILRDVQEMKVDVQS